MDCIITMDTETKLEKSTSGQPEIEMGITTINKTAAADNHTDNDINNVDMNMVDVQNLQQLLATSKILNCLMAKLWRGAREDIAQLRVSFRNCEVQAEMQIAKLQQVVSLEKSHNNQLMRRVEKMLINEKNIKLTSALQCEELNQINDQLHEQLRKKTMEMRDISEMLETYKVDMFKQMSKLRDTTQELANEHRYSQRLRNDNHDLQDQLIYVEEKMRRHCGSLMSRLRDQRNENIRYEQEIGRLITREQKLTKALACNAASGKWKFRKFLVKIRPILVMAIRGAHLLSDYQPTRDVSISVINSLCPCSMPYKVIIASIVVTGVCLVPNVEEKI